MKPVKCDVLVIGGGPAGLSAACAAKETGVSSVILIERDRELGGILRQCVHTGFGLRTFKEDLTGPEYALRFIRKAEALGIRVELGTFVLSISSDKRVRTVDPVYGEREFVAGSIVLCMGCREKTRGALSIPGTRPAGVWTAGAAQRLINVEGYMPGKRVVVAGSGDVGLIMARRLHLEGAEVLGVVEIAPYPGGLTRNVVQCLEDYDIPLLLSHSVIEIGGKDRVQWIKIAETDSRMAAVPGTEKVIRCDTLLLSVGLVPENELTRGIGVTLDSRTGGPMVTNFMETCISGIFASGNVVHVNDLVDNVSDEAATAGKEAARFVQRGSQRETLRVEVVPGERVRSVVPQRIVATGREPVPIDLRISEPIDDAKVEIRAGDRLLATYRRRNARPGEMVRVSLTRSQMDSIPRKIGKVTVSIDSLERGSA